MAVVGERGGILIEAGSQAVGAQGLRCAQAVGVEGLRCGRRGLCIPG